MHPEIVQSFFTGAIATLLIYNLSPIVSAAVSTTLGYFDTKPWSLRRLVGQRHVG